VIIALIAVGLSGLGLREQLRNVPALKGAYFWVQNLLDPPMELVERGNSDKKNAILLAMPIGIAEDDRGNIYFSDRGLSRKEGPGRVGRVIWKIDSNGKAQVIAGTGRRGIARSDVPALQSNLGSPEGLRLDDAGRIYFADPWNHVVLRLEVDGTLSRIAGSGAPGHNGDEIPALQAQLNQPYDVALDSLGNVYIADSANNRIRKVDKNGIIHTVAGTGEAGYTGDNGPATQATLRVPYNVAVDKQDRVIIPDSLNHVIRRIAHDGTIETIAGVGRPGYAGDGGPATLALLDAPQAIVFDRDGNLIFGDEHNHVIRMISSDGTISTVVGTGTAGLAADGAKASEAPLNDPEGLLLRSDGTLIVNDGRNRRILEITAGGTVLNFAGRGWPRAPESEFAGAYRPETGQQSR